ncbi:MAG TPA: signal peptide peptidase SppA [Candidatus Deferrimicrobiaceae bacterium]
MTEGSHSPGRKSGRPFLRGCVVILAALAGFFLLLGILSRMEGLSGIGAGKVGLVRITGLIAESESAIEQIRKFARDDSIQAIVLRVNSPGGGVGPSQEIYEEVRKLRGKKVVVTSMGALAASGGYYIACASEKIYANPGTITGSIGVIMNFVNVRDLVEKIGIRGMVVKSGEYKDIGSPVRDMKPGERRLLQGVIDNVHAQFVNAVAEGRGLDRKQVLAIADGRIFSGEQARELGLVDTLGNLQDAVEEAGRMAKIEGEPKLVLPPKKRLSILELLRDEAKSIIDETLSQPRFRFEYLAR